MSSVTTSGRDSTLSEGPVHGETVAEAATTETAIVGIEAPDVAPQAHLEMEAITAAPIERDSTRGSSTDSLEVAPEAAAQTGWRWQQRQCCGTCNSGPAAV